jgi:hypothetical protein
VKPKFKERPKAKEKFERAMTMLFQVKKTELIEKIKNKVKKGED